LSEINKTKQLENLFIRKITNRKIRRIFAKTEKKSIKKKVSPHEKVSPPLPVENDTKTGDEVLTPISKPPVLVDPNRDNTQADLIEFEKEKRNFKTGEEWARQGIEWLSNSSITQPNFLWFIKYVILSEHKRKMERSARMNWGKLLGEWGGLVATDYCSIQQAMVFITDSCKRYIASTVNEHDAEMNEFYLTFAKGMLEEIEYQIRYQKRDGETIQLERPTYYQIDGINVLWHGFIDIAYVDASGILQHWIELKTSYPSPNGFYKRDIKNKKTGEVKSQGSRIWKYPSTPDKPRDIHLSQMTIYAHTENMLGDMLYVNPRESRLFNHKDYEELQWDRLAHELEIIKEKALVRQQILMMSDDPLKIIKLIPPEYDHYFFKNIEPEYKQMIYDIYNNKKKANK